MGKQARTKRRSSSQRIGDEGERIFALWGTRRGLSVNKVENDFGIDFFCEILIPGPEGRRSEAVTGKSLAVQVRGTARNVVRPRITMDRIDADNLLLHSHLTCLIAVDVKSDNVYFKFVDGEFVEILCGFLRNSSQQTMSLRLDQFSSDPSEFRHRLDSLSKLLRLNKLNIHKSKQRLSLRFPGSRIEIFEAFEKEVALLQLSNPGAAFVVDPARREEARRLVFDNGVPPHEAPGAELKPEFVKLVDLGQDFTFVLSPPRHMTLKIECEKRQAKLVFEVRTLEDEIAFYHPLGLRLSFSGKRPLMHAGGQVGHELDASLVRGNSSLLRARDASPFLDLMRTGAVISIRDWKVPLAKWGDWLCGIAEPVAALKRVVDRLGIDTQGIYLSDFREDELPASITFFENFMGLNCELDGLFSGFIITPLHENEDDYQRTPVEMELPIVSNIGAHGIVFWIEMAGRVVHTADNSIRGFEFVQQGSTRWEIFPRFNKSVFPEVWLATGVPRIALRDREQILLTDPLDTDLAVEALIYTVGPRSE